MRNGRALVVLTVLLMLGLHGVASAGINEDWKKTGASFWSLDAVARRVGWKDVFGQSIAVVVGVGNYDHFPRLSAPAPDALRVRDFLRDEAGFDRIITITDEEATYARIANLMERVIPALVGPKDRFLFYFSGHGATRVLSRGKRGYLVLKTSQADAWDDMINMDWVKSQWADNVGHARHTLFLLDSCFSGLAAFEAKGEAGDKTVERLMQPGHHIVTAGTEGEKSFIYGEQSLFTQAFLAAARGEGMAPGDGVVSLSEMMTRVNRSIDRKRAELRDQIKMTPRQYYSWTDNNAGEFFFVPQGRGGARVAVAPVTGTIESKDPGSIASPQIREVSQAPGSAFTIRRRTVATGTLANSSFVASLQACEQKCEASSRCNSYSFGSASLTCYEYQTAEFRADANYDSGVRNASLSSATTAYNMAFKAEAIGRFLGASYLDAVGDCQQYCSRTSGCMTFSFSRISRTCYLYSTASLVKNDVYDSGTRDLSLWAATGPIVAAANPTANAPSSASASLSAIDIRTRTSASGAHARDSTFVASLDVCQGLCLRTDDCKVFAFSRSTGACYFYRRAELERHDSYDVGIRDPSGVSKGGSPR